MHQQQALPAWAPSLLVRPAVVLGYRTNNNYILTAHVAERELGILIVRLKLTGVDVVQSDL